MLLKLETVYETLAQTHNFHFTTVTAPFSGLETFDYGIRKQLIPEFDFCSFGSQLLETVPTGEFILTQDEFQCSYALFKLPDTSDSVYLCGPVVRSAMTEETKRKIQKQYGLQNLKMVSAIYQNIRIEYDTHSLSFMLELYERTFPGAGIRCREISGFLPCPVLATDYQEKYTAFEERPEDMFLEKKYLQEMRLMGAISCGNSKEALGALSELEQYQVPQIVRSTSVNLKNQMLSVNAICKYAVAATQKVHPVYIERIYETYVMKVEYVNNIREMSRLINHMISAYCECVQVNALTQYSPLIRRVIDHIHLHLEQPLSLRQLARICNVNASYLSNLFRTEVGIPLTEYINRRRIEQSAPLLRYSKLSIAQIGAQVGILDENYYARLFRKYKGISPKDYREQPNP